MESYMYYNLPFFVLGSAQENNIQITNNLPQLTVYHTTLQYKTSIKKCINVQRWQTHKGTEKVVWKHPPTYLTFMYPHYPPSPEPSWPPLEFSRLTMLWAPNGSALLPSSLFYHEFFPIFPMPLGQMRLCHPPMQSSYSSWGYLGDADKKRTPFQYYEAPHAWPYATPQVHRSDILALLDPRTYPIVMVRLAATDWRGIDWTEIYLRKRIGPLFWKSICKGAQKTAQVDRPWLCVILVLAWWRCGELRGVPFKFSASTRP